MRARLALLVSAVLVVWVILTRWPAPTEVAVGATQLKQERSSVTGQPRANSRAMEDADAPPKAAADAAADASKAYRFRRTCAGVAMFDEFLLAQVANPHSWMNDERAAASQLTPEYVESIRASLERRRVHGVECARLGRSVDDGSIYALALRAANAGDTEAAVCYVLARWPPPKDPHFQGPRLPHGDQGFDPRFSREYQANARRLVDEGLQRGDWRMVSVVDQAWIDRHGQLIGGLKDFSVPDEQYRMIKLKLLSTPPEQAAELERQLEIAEQTIPASRLGIADARAKALFERSFSDKGAYGWNPPSCYY